MIKTMLVEDERIILEDLLTIINWQDEGFSIVATARNGKQGLQKFEQYQPELIITDIRMPILDGLSMMKSIKHTHPAVHFLFLSAYSEFDYAKEALRLGAWDYILKTEISEKYLKEKLGLIRTAMTDRTDLLYSAVEKKLNDFITAPDLFDRLAASPGGPHSELQKLLQPLHALPEPVAASHVMEFLLPAVQKQYEDLLLPEKFQPTAPDTLADIQKWLLAQLQEIAHLRELVFKRQYSPVIINAIAYIREHYSDPELKISLVADHVGLSSGRFSVLFKKEVGKTVNDFITELRIQEARKLLASGKYKVYQVTELVGYKTSQYFSQIFYQYTGQYPNQYRRGRDL